MTKQEAIDWVREITWQRGPTNFGVERAIIARRYRDMYLNQRTVEDIFDTEARLDRFGQYGGGQI